MSSNVASVSPIPAGSKKIDPNMKGTSLSLSQREQHMLQWKEIYRASPFTIALFLFGQQPLVFVSVVTETVNLTVNQTENHFTVSSSYVTSRMEP